MKLKLLALLSIYVIIGCQKDETIENESCHQMEPNISYVEEEFKPNYTIQFPDNYTGEGLFFPSEIPVFRKFSPSGVNFHCEFLCATDCHIYFGQILETPYPETITYSDFTNQNNSEILDKKIEFCLDQELYMILYYSSGEFKKSKLFILDNGKLKDGLIVEFEKRNIEEVIEVIKTIKMK